MNNMAMANQASGLVKDKGRKKPSPPSEMLQKPRTIFRPGARISMNCIPIFLNLVLPWGMFVLICACCSFSAMYRRPSLVYTIVFVTLIMCLVLIFTAFWARSNEQEPTWFTYTSVMFLVAWVCGVWIGDYNFQGYMKWCYEIEDLKVLGQVDTGKEQGQNMMDAGVVYFSADAKLDGMHSWHFKHGTTYCVAPIGSRKGTPPDTQTYDFWAVGTDCCAVGASDFRCGDWKDPMARSGIRALDEDALQYFRLAVSQAESLYDVKASHPVFFWWTKDPVADLHKRKTQGFVRFLYAACLFFVCSMISMSVAILRFSFLGRASSPYTYATKMAREAHDQPGGYSHPSMAYGARQDQGMGGGMMPQMPGMGGMGGMGGMPGGGYGSA